jgi:hypothetical protein
VSRLKRGCTFPTDADWLEPHAMTAALSGTPSWCRSHARGFHRSTLTSIDSCRTWPTMNRTRRGAEAEAHHRLRLRHLLHGLHRRLLRFVYLVVVAQNKKLEWLLLQTRE